MPVGEEADILDQQLVEHVPLVVGDDAVADAQHDDLLAVARRALQREQAERGGADQHQRMEILVHIGLVDHVAEQIGRERGTQRRHAHEDKREDVELAMAHRMLGEQPPDHGRRAVRLSEQRLKALTDHAAQVLKRFR